MLGDQVLDHADAFYKREMPIFDHRSAELRRRLYDGPDSVVARWLGPHALDAWRIDVANMTGIHGSVDVALMYSPFSDYTYEQGIAVQALSPNPLTYLHFIDASLAIDFCQAHNDDLAATVRRHPDRFVGLDALPMQEETGLPFASTIPGRMHACGHDGHTATLLAAAKWIAEEVEFDGTLNLIFQPAEEGAGGAVRMMADGSADFARATGLTLDLTDKGLGLRSGRYSMLVKDGVVAQLNNENGGGFAVSDADTLLKQIQA